MADEPDLVFRQADDAALLTRVRASYLALPEPSVEQIDRCVEAVLELGATGQRRDRRHLLRPRWWWGAAAAATLILAVMRPWHNYDVRRHAGSAFAAGANELPLGSTRDEGGEVRFDLILPIKAEAVSIVGDFNDWDESRTPMVRRGSEGTWSVRVPLSPGRYTYAFVVDGREWLIDALAPQVPDVGFGPANAVIVDGQSH